MERDPWFSEKNCTGPFPVWEEESEGDPKNKKTFSFSPLGCKEDGGGCHRAQGKVGGMVLHRACCNRDMQALRTALAAGVNLNEVEAAGNTPLHSAAFEGWKEGVELLLESGARALASNNAGDRPWHWATNMGHDEVADLLLSMAGPKAAEQGLVIVQDHVPKVKEFFSKPCWAHHPKPYKDFIEAKRKSDAVMRAAASADGAGLLPGL